MCLSEQTSGFGSFLAVVLGGWLVGHSTPGPGPGFGAEMSRTHTMSTGTRFPVAGVWILSMTSTMLPFPAAGCSGPVKTCIVKRSVNMECARTKRSNELQVSLTPSEQLIVDGGNDRC